jgi:hypothetical protein
MHLLLARVPKLFDHFQIVTRSVFRNRVAGIAVGLAASLAIAAPATAGIHQLNSAEATLFKRISSNAGQQREKLVLHPILCKVARQRAADMARRGYASHTNPEGLGPNTLVRGAGFVLPSSYDASPAGNNIESFVAAHGTPKEAVTLWLESIHHRPHILGEDGFYQEQTSIGVGVVRSTQAPYYKYHVFLSAPPNAAISPRSVVLKNPKGMTIASTRPLADAWDIITRRQSR